MVLDGNREIRMYNLSAGVLVEFLVLCLSCITFKSRLICLAANGQIALSFGFLIIRVKRF